jgi:hypothetical protein
MRATADFDPEWSGSYFVPRATVIPPPQLAAAVWPELDSWKARLDSGDIEQNKAAGAFIELLYWLRQVLLQDAALLLTDFPDHPLFEAPIFHSLEFSVFAARVRESCNGIREDPQSLAIEKTIPAVSEKLRTLATQLQASERLDLRRYYDLKDQLDRLERKIDNINHVGWHVSITPMGRHIAQQFQHNTQGQGQGQISPPQPVTPPVPQPLDQPERSPLEPLSLNSLGQMQTKIPPLYTLPRNITTVVGLVQLWREGVGGMPPVRTLEQRWGTRWRPAKEKSYYSTRRSIIDEVARRAEASGLSEYDVARQMDREKGTASLDKVMKLLRSRRKQPLEADRGTGSGENSGGDGRGNSGV